MLTSKWIISVADWLTLVLSWGCCVTAIAWLVIDGYADQVLSFGELLPAHIRQSRWTLLGVLLVTFFVSWAYKIRQFLFGSLNGRSVRMLFLATIQASLWIAVVIQWRSIVEWGREQRIARHAVAIKSFSQSLMEHWPKLPCDLEGHAGCSEKAAYQSYPIGTPKMMMLLSEYEIPATGIAFQSVEIGNGESMRFELSGSNRGYWLELRRDHQVPTSFVGGLEEYFELKQSRRVCDHLYLVRYHSK